jgi:hypothetical protein
MASRASVQAMRQMQALMCRPPAVRAAVQSAGRVAGGGAAAGAGGRIGGSAASASTATVKRLMSTGGMGAGEGIAAGACGRTAAAVQGARVLTAGGPVVTKAALGMARTLMHDHTMELELFGESGEIDDT